MIVTRLPPIPREWPSRSTDGASQMTGLHVIRAFDFVEEDLAKFCGRRKRLCEFFIWSAVIASYRRFIFVSGLKAW